jgi:hypothetical protein
MNSSVAHVPSYTPDPTPTPEKGYPVMYRITNRRFASASECDDSITEFESYADACRAFNSQVELILTFIAGIDGHVEPIEGQTQFAYFSDSKRAARVFVDYELSNLQKIQIKNQDIFRFIYHMLDSDEKQKFYAFFTKIMPSIKESKTFLHQPKKAFLGEILREVLSRLRIKKDVNWNLK